MLKIALSGCNGRMGRAITELASQRGDMEIVAGFDAVPNRLSTYPVYADPFEYTGEMDVYVDFSTASALDHILEYCVPRGIPLLLATTGHSDAQLAALHKAAEKIAVFKSPNLSLGVAVLSDLVRRATRILGADYDIEIIERHHNQKLDAPSGTAMSLAQDVQAELPFSASWCMTATSAAKSVQKMKSECTRCAAVRLSESTRLCLRVRTRCSQSITPRSRAKCLPQARCMRQSILPGAHRVCIICAIWLHR